MKIYAVRHGQTDWNLEGRIQGQSDTPLNENGRAQAREAAKTIPKDVDIIVTSPMARAIETSEIINEQFGLEIIRDKRIVERSFGDYEGLLISEAGVPPMICPESDAAPPNVETPREMAKRVFSFLDDVIKNYEGKTVLVVTHRQILRAFRWYFNGYQNAEEGLIINNCEICVFETR